MTDRRDVRVQGVKRTLVTKNRECSLGVISCSNLKWTDHQVKLVDHSVIGVGIESEQPINPGIIWFKECIYGQKCGSLVWCKKIGSRYRAGIQFIAFSREQEELLRKQIERLKSHEPLQDPEGIISALIADLKKEEESSGSDD